MNPMLRKLLLATVLSALSAFTPAQAATEDAAAAAPRPAMRTITPVFGQLVSFTLPAGFVPAFTDGNKDQYIQESVPTGESVEKWSQMITLTGARGLAANPDLTPVKFAAGMLGGFKRVCPNSLGVTGLGPVRIGPHEGFAAVMSCGTAGPAATPYSESMLLIVVKGSNDYYTLQWAERGAASKTAIAFDGTKWTERLRKLAPLRLCPIVPGEAAPYPSCIKPQ